MNFAVPNFLPVMPEIFLLVAICSLLVIDLFLPDEKRGVTYALAHLLGRLTKHFHATGKWL